MTKSITTQVGPKSPTINKKQSNTIQLQELYVVAEIYSSPGLWIESRSFGTWTSDLWT